MNQFREFFEGISMSQWFDQISIFLVAVLAAFGYLFDVRRDKKITRAGKFAFGFVILALVVNVISKFFTYKEDAANTAFKRNVNANLATSLDLIKKANADLKATIKRLDSIKKTIEEVAFPPTHLWISYRYKYQVPIEAFDALCPNFASDTLKKLARSGYVSNGHDTAVSITMEMLRTASEQSRNYIQQRSPSLSIVKDTSYKILNNSGKALTNGKWIADGISLWDQNKGNDELRCAIAYGGNTITVEIYGYFENLSFERSDVDLLGMNDFLNQYLMFGILAPPKAYNFVLSDIRLATDKRMIQFRNVKGRGRNYQFDVIRRIQRNNIKFQ